MPAQLSFIEIESEVKPYKVKIQNFSKLRGSLWTNLNSDVFLTFEKFKNRIFAWVYTKNEPDLLTQISPSALESQIWTKSTTHTDTREETLTFVKFNKSDDIVPVKIQDFTTQEMLTTNCRREENPQNLSFKQFSDRFRAVLWSDDDLDAKLSFDFRCLRGSVWSIKRNKRKKADNSGISQD